MAYSKGRDTLLNHASATGAAVQWPGGRGVFTLPAGTISGATVKLQYSPDDGTTYLDVDRSGDTFVTFTAVGGAGGLFELPPCLIKAAVSGGTPSGLYAYAQTVNG